MQKIRDLDRLMPGKFLTGLIRIYQAVVPVARTLFCPVPFFCRFIPSCSDYMIASIKKFGAVQGLWIGMIRIGTCHPHSRSGIDPLPKVKTWKKI